MSKASKTDKVLIISLTNIGDVVLTFPVVDILRRDFPDAKFSIVIGPKAESLFQGSPYFDKVYVFDKHQFPLKTLSWVIKLRRQHFDLVVDLRNTAIPFMIAARRRTSCRVDKTLTVHMREKHLRQLRSVHAVENEACEPQTLFIPETDRGYIRKIVDEDIGAAQKFVVVAPGAADSAKRWSEEGFAHVCDWLTAEHQHKIVFVGDEEDRKVAQRIDKLMETQPVNLCGRTSLVQLAELLRHCSFTLVNDSAPMHLASYLNVPVLALFGPTDPTKYRPWGKGSRLIKKESDCPACREPKGGHRHNCMQAITKEDVLDEVTRFFQYA